MPTWPTNKPDSNRFNSDSDSIKQSREDLKTMSDAVNDIVDFVDTTGIADGKILVYNASNARFEIGDGGGLSNPLTENLETERFLIGRIAPDSASGNNPTAIQFTDTNAINLISTQSYFPDSAGDQVFLDAGTVTLQNYIKGRVSSSTGNPIPTFDHAGIKLFSAGTLDSAGDDETSQIGLTAGGRGVFITHGDATIGGGNGGQNIYLDNTRGLLLNNTIPNVDSAGDDPSSITLQTSAGNVRLEPNNTIYLKYALWPTTDGSNGQILQTNGAGQLSWVTNTGGSGLTDIVNDTTPQLGGNLDVNGNDIVTTSNANLELAPDGSGKTVLRGNDNSGALQFNCENNSHGQVVQAQPHSAGVTNNLTLPAGGDQELVGASATQTLTNKRLTSPKINEDVALTSTATELNLLDGITGIADEDNMSSDSNTKLATQQSIKAYVDAEVASAGGGGATGDVSAGNNISLSNPDSAGQSAINLRSPFNQPVDAGDQQLSNLSIKNYGEIVHDLGTTGGTLTPDPNNGSVQKVILNNNLTLNSLSNVASGDSLTLLVTQDGTGGRTLSSTMKFAGGTKTLSTGANAIDVITIFYDGTNYLASLSTNFS